MLCQATLLKRASETRHVNEEDYPDTKKNRLSVENEDSRNRIARIENYVQRKRVFR